ncbi:MAG TPA: hypothetical protein VEB64_16475 [Azospirillaceae bacterium]|nr:hypothetical protein [Azospirillaceae bacterium]
MTATTFNFTSAAATDIARRYVHGSLRREEAHMALVSLGAGEYEASNFLDAEEAVEDIE